MNDESDSAVAWHGTRPDEAAFLKSLLEGEGIPCEILGANQSTQRMFSGGMAFGLRLLVPASREADARALIARSETAMRTATAPEDGADWVEVYRTPSEDDARNIAGLLGESGIASELAAAEGEDGEPASALRVSPAAEKEAVRVIAEHLEGRGLRPEEGGAESTGGAVCPNCAHPVPRSEGEACEECGYAVHGAPLAPPARFGRAFPDAPSCCPECCSPSTRLSGSCPDCGVPLEPAEKDAPVCPEGRHMLVKGEAPGWVCPGCRAAWLES